LSMKPAFALLFLLFSTLLPWSCRNYSQSDAQQSAARSAPVSFDSGYLKEKLSYLIKDSLEAQLFAIDSSGITVYADQRSREIDSPEFRLFVDEVASVADALDHLSGPELIRYYRKKGTKPLPHEARSSISELSANPPLHPQAPQPLKGWRIAVDPGHISGTLALAEIEGKFVKMHPQPLTQQTPIGFWEANLTLATAYLIRDQLTRLGAKVIMTRGTPGLSVAGLSYQDWKAKYWPQVVKDSAIAWELTQDQLDYWLNKAEEKVIYRSFFNAEDLRNRAELINGFRPHCTLIIHYNVHGPNWENRDQENFLPPADTNYLMAFIPGGFLAGELSKVEERVALLRLLLTQDWENSQRLTKACLTHSVDKTGVPRVPKENELGYLARSSIYAGADGLYARNLTLTRLVESPLVYGESLNQDYLGEAMQLNKRDTVIHGIMASTRLTDVAEAFVAAVLDYAGE
ncbi:MAG: hypothetical protein AAF804_18655, partial [Bacteroidota bacterium]